MWSAEVRRPIDYAIDPIFYVGRTLSVCELSDIGHIHIYIVYVGDRYIPGRSTSGPRWIPVYWFGSPVLERGR